MKPLKIGISGVRGIVGETFTPELVVGFAQAFGTYFDAGRILVCRDTRALHITGRRDHRQLDVDDEQGSWQGHHFHGRAPR